MDNENQEVSFDAFAPVELTVDEPVDEVIDAEVIDDAPVEPVEETLYEIVVDGQVEKLTLEEVKKLASHGKAAGKRMQEAGKLKSDAEKLLQLAKSDPVALLKHLSGGDFDERDFLTKRMAALLDEDLMTPEEKSQREQMRELEELRAEARSRKEAEEREALEKQAAEQQVLLDKEIGDALRDANVPKNPAAVKRLATYMYDAVEAGLDIPTVKLAQQVRKDIEQELKDLLSVSDDDTFSNLLGSDLLTKAQKLSLKQIKTPGVKVPPNTAKKSSDTAPTKTVKSKDDLLKDLGLGDSLF